MVRNYLVLEKHEYKWKNCFFWKVFAFTIMGKMSQKVVFHYVGTEIDTVLYDISTKCLWCESSTGLSLYGISLSQDTLYL